MFSRVAMDQFKVEPDWNGMIMSYIGVIAMVSLEGRLVQYTMLSCHIPQLHLFLSIRFLFE